MPSAGLAEINAAMTANDSSVPASSRVPNRAINLGLGLVLLAVCVAAGVSMLGAPWIQGDEIIFIADNGDVTGAGRDEALWQRCIRIFTHTHEDLYQPFTILTYALEWAAWPPLWRIPGIRLTDVLIHALNAVLLWAALRRLLDLFEVGAPAARTGVGWAFALLWAAHPMLVGAYSADMGRTHLLSTTFTLLALLFQIAALRDKQGSWYLAAFFALALAMLNKPVVGWVVVVFSLEWFRRGSTAFRQPYLFAVAALCGFFAWLTLTTTRGTLLLEDSPLPVFGEPLPRALLGLGVYLRNMAAPLGVTPWYPPDIATNWLNPLVWLGAGFIVVVLLFIARVWRKPEWAPVAIGLIWFLVNWLPLSGIVSARVFAAQDRYMYLPMMGLLLALTTCIVQSIGRAQPLANMRAIAAGAVAMIAAAIVLPFDRTLCEASRSTLARALTTLSKYPNDPRVMEFVAVAYDFGSHRQTPESSAPNPPDWQVETINALRMAANLAETGPQYFADANSRAAFHRRISFVLWANGLYEASLSQAHRAFDFEPNSRLTWLRIAHALRAMEQFNEARAAYERLEQLVTPQSPDYAIRLTEFADLLLSRFEEPGAALPRFRKALDSGQLDAATRVLATIGLARCEVLAGQGVEGYRLALGVLRVQPDNLDAVATIALYHLLSHHWEDAVTAYQQVLASAPNDYESLRGYNEACARIGAWKQAVIAWETAIAVEPNQIVYRSYWVWALACANDPEAATWANRLLELNVGNRFACLANALLATRAERIDDALQWIVAAQRGEELPRARELVRAESAMSLMLERNELPVDAALPLAALMAANEKRNEALKLLDTYVNGEKPRLAEAAKRLAAEIQASAPTTASTPESSESATSP